MRCSSCIDVAVVAGIAVGYVVAGCLSPIVGVVGLLGGIPRYFYKLHQLNQQRKKSAAEIDQLAAQVLGDKTRVVNDKNYMDPKSKFTTQTELNALKICQSNKKSNDEIAVKIKKAQKAVTKKEKEVLRASVWIKSFVLCLFAHLGLACAIGVHSKAGGSFRVDVRDIYDVYRRPLFMRIHDGRGMYQSETLALNYHVAVTQRIVERQDTIAGVKKVLTKVPQTAGHRLDLVQERILSFLIDKDAFSKKPRAKAPATRAAGVPAAVGESEVKIRNDQSGSNPPPVRAAPATIVPATMNDFRAIMHGQGLVGLDPVGQL